MDVISEFGNSLGRSVKTVSEIWDSYLLTLRINPVRAMRWVSPKAAVKNLTTTNFVLLTAGWLSPFAGAGGQD